MSYILGLLIAFFSIVFSIFHLHQEASNYFDVIALSMVLGGTIAVTAMTIPARSYPELLRLFWRVFWLGSRDHKVLLDQGFKLVEAVEGRHAVSFNDEKVPSHRQDYFAQLLKEGYDLITLGFSRDLIEQILVERIQKHYQRSSQLAQTLRGLSKYPPAFGLMGTILGLVSLMRSLGESRDPREVGMRMGVALIATFYGILFANLVIGPAGERILKVAMEEKQEGEFALESIILACERTPIFEALEILNSHFEPQDRKSWKTDASPSGEAA